ncbi:hypothetical protein [Massilia phyllosphaerae]|uniref:hypothetical protein n=1 Tax=Massilia phyllosphaerae TaxID=3106034 RepID=UPI002B1CC59C|nr:hypothetical protein [Massilia sp. SGZ-792]
MDPINYLAMVPQQDFLRDIQGGLQLGAGFREAQQLRDARDLALQQKQVAMQRQQQYQSDVSAALTAPRDQQAQLFSALALRNPDQYEAITKSWGAMSAEQQKSELRDTFTIASALHADRPDLALSQINERITAAKNSNQPTQDLEALRGLVEKDPKAAYGQVLHIASVLPGGKDVLANLQSIGQEQRAAAESDVKVTGGQADNAQKAIGIVGQTLGSLQGKGAKPAQAYTAIKSLQSRGLLSADDAAALRESVPTDVKALDAWFGQQRDAGIKADDQKKYTTPDANARLSADTQIRTTSMNNATQLAVQDRIAARQDAKADTEASLDSDTLRSMAEQYVDGGDKTVLQNLGRGAQGSANLVALRAEITKVAKERGLSGSQIAAKLADYQGLTAGIRTSAQISARVENAISEAKELAPLAIAAGRDVSRSGFLPFGKAQIMFNTQTNDPALKKFATANNGLVTAYAGAMSRGQKPTQALFDHAQKMLSEAQDQKSYEAAVSQMYAEMDAASRAPQKVREHLRGEIGGSHGATTVLNPVAAPAIPAGWSVKEH